MSKILKRTKAGRLVSAVLYTAPASGDPPKARAQKQKASTWAREKLNAQCREILSRVTSPEELTAEDRAVLLQNLSGHT